MTEAEFRADLLASAASRAEVQSCGQREGFVAEVLDRLRDAGEVPEGEPCQEILRGQGGVRKLEIDAWADDEADGSLHLFVAMFDNGPEAGPVLTLVDAKDQGFNRLLGVYENSRSGWLLTNIEESRPLWDLARRVQTGVIPTALRLNVVSDRSVSERLKAIPGDQTHEGVPVTFQIWDMSRLKRIHDSRSVRDDLVVEFRGLAAGGLPVLPASVGVGDYDAYLAVVPGEILADVYLTHGSRLLEGNVRTFLGRGGGVNKGIATTIAQHPGKFFAFNNGIAATASSITTDRGPDGVLVITSATDLQIVNGAQTTASLATARRDKSLVPGSVFVPMKLSVVTPEVGGELIPAISKFSNRQNGVRESDFFATHAFHRRLEETSRRILAPTVAGSQVSTHWYYERARGQYLNAQAGLTTAQRSRFALQWPRKQVITKTDLAKSEMCFGFTADVTCKGAEKAFVAFAERTTTDWKDETLRAGYGDEWFKMAVARIIIFRAAEAIVSKASWYQEGYRSQIVAYSCMRLAALATELGSGLDYLKIWNQQGTGTVIDQQLSIVGEEMLNLLLAPPKAGQNVGEWAKQQACRKVALETRVEILPKFEGWVCSGGEQVAVLREARRGRRVQDEIDIVAKVLHFEPTLWAAMRDFCRTHVMVSPDEERALTIACKVPAQVLTEKQARCLMRLVERTVDLGWAWPK